MSDEVTIRAAKTVEDYRACQDAQRRAWGITEDGYVVPVATMVGAQLHGGLVLGAFVPSGEAVGLSFAFLGKFHGQLCLYSQLTGVVPGFQAKGIGLKLKQAQWEYARSEGLALLAWAFDPLQSGNAHFNLDKLGATCGRFVENMYGVRTDALNAGVPTDRLIAEWSTTPRSDHAIDLVAAVKLPRILEATLSPDGVAVVGSLRLDLTAPQVLLEIPADIQAIRKNGPAIAEEWARAVRSAFQTGFGAGHRAVGFVRIAEGERRRCFYVLTKP